MNQHVVHECNVEHVGRESVILKITEKAQQARCEGGRGGRERGKGVKEGRGEREGREGRKGEEEGCEGREGRKGGEEGRGGRGKD